MTFPQNHREYLIEAAGLGLFMVSACAFASLLEHPASPVRAVIADAFVRRALMGLAMGLTAIAIIYSPWGRISGAHINPSVTLTYLRLGKVAPSDAAAYVAAQFAGGGLGVACASMVIGAPLADESVAFVATRPGAFGEPAAFVAEVVIAFVLMTAVLAASSSPRLERFTGSLAGALIATYITFEAPISGMSMNPARTLASALAARDFTALWIYFVAPPLGMLAAAQLHLAYFGDRGVECAKLRHDTRKRCIFCEHQQAR